MKSLFKTTLSLLLIASCGTTKEVEKSNIPCYQPLEICKNYEGNADIAQFETIELKAPDNMLLSDVRELFITDSLLIVADDTKVLAFTMNGDFVRSYGSAGNAKNEFTNVHSLTVTPDDKELCVFDNNKIVSYNISDGTFIRSFDGLNKTGFSTGIAAGGEGRIYFFKSYGSTQYWGEEQLPAIECCDKNGSFINNFMTWTDLVYGRSPFTRTYDNAYLMRGQCGQSVCYQITADSVAPHPRFEFDFGKKMMPYRYGHTDSKDGKDIITAFSIRDESDYIQSLSSIIDNEKYVSLRTLGKRGVFQLCVINKESEEGYFFTVDRTNSSFRAVKGDYFYGIHTLFPFRDRQPLDTDFETLMRNNANTSENANGTYIYRCKFTF